MLQILPLQIKLSQQGRAEESCSAKAILRRPNKKHKKHFQTLYFKTEKEARGLSISLTVVVSTARVLQLAKRSFIGPTPVSQSYATVMERVVLFILFLSEIYVNADTQVISLPNP